MQENSFNNLLEEKEDVHFLWQALSVEDRNSKDELQVARQELIVVDADYPIILCRVFKLCAIFGTCRSTGQGTIVNQRVFYCVSSA